jgi:CheY-like chemotaxis protein
MKKNEIKILIVDDHPAVRSTMIDVLNEEGFITDHAKDGKIALTKCLTNAYNYVLMDVQMPEMNGIEVFRELKTKVSNPPKFIFFTAYSLPELEDEAIKLGCLAFLAKPIKIERILSLIQNTKNLPVLVYLKSSKQAEEIVKRLQDEDFYALLTQNIDDALIQLRQINYSFLIFDSDLPGSEQEALHKTIKTLKINTNSIETNEDESIELPLGKVHQLI